MGQRLQVYEKGLRHHEILNMAKVSKILLISGGSEVTNAPSAVQTKGDGYGHWQELEVMGSIGFDLNKQ